MTWAISRSATSIVMHGYSGGITVMRIPAAEISRNIDSITDVIFQQAAVKL